MALIASWEVLAVDDVGESEVPGARRYLVSTVTELIDGTLLPVQVELSLSPPAMARWLAAVEGQRVIP